MSLNDKCVPSVINNVGRTHFHILCEDFCWDGKTTTVRAPYMLGKYSTYDEVISGRIWYTAKMWAQRINNIGRAQKMLP